MDYLRRTWADIDLDAVVHNYQEMKKCLDPGCLSMAVVKADAYGHGDGYVSRALQKAGVDWFAVSNLNEAVSLRRQGIDKPVLILGFTPPAMADRLAELNVSQTVYSEEYAKALSAQAKKKGVTVDCHIKVDTGMTRIGFYAPNGHECEAAEEIAAACALPGLSCTGIYTHFACADEFQQDSREYTLGQYAVFIQTLEELRRLGITFSLRHCCNSAATMAYPQMHLDMVRLGIVLYGLAPSGECAGMADLRPAMSLYTTVSMVKKLEAGVPVSYGRTYTTEHDRQVVASIAVGYADGYRRNLSNRGRVIVGGEYAPVVGRVCMDQMMIDVTDIPQVQSGDVVTLVGRCGDLAVTLDDFAQWNGTINYEEACLIGRRVPRVYIEDGREAAVIDYVIEAL